MSPSPEGCAARASISTAVGRNDGGEAFSNPESNRRTALTPFEKVLADTARRREANAKRENALALKESSKLKVTEIYPVVRGTITPKDTI